MHAQKRGPDLLRHHKDPLKGGPAVPVHGPGVAAAPIVDVDHGDLSLCPHVAGHKVGGAALHPGHRRVVGLLRTPGPCGDDRPQQLIRLQPPPADHGRQAPGHRAQLARPVPVPEKAGGGARRQGPAAGLVQDGAAVPPAVQQPHMGRDPAHQLAPAQQDIQVDGQLPVPQELQHLQQGLLRPAHAQRVNDKQDFPHGPPPAARTPDHPPVGPADAAGRPAAMRPA